MNERISVAVSAHSAVAAAEFTSLDCSAEVRQSGASFANARIKCAVEAVVLAAALAFPVVSVVHEDHRIVADLYVVDESTTHLVWWVNTFGEIVPWRNDAGETVEWG